jgi:hypothetical protein
MTFQFEKANQIQGTPVTNVTTTVNPAPVVNPNANQTAQVSTNSASA